MDSAVAYFKGFFAISEDGADDCQGESHQTAEIVEHTPSPTVGEFDDDGDDLEIGQSHTTRSRSNKNRSVGRNNKRSSSASTLFSFTDTKLQRMMSMLSNMLASENNNSQNNGTTGTDPQHHDPSKSSTSYYSTSLGHIFGIRPDENNTSDTSSTQSSSDDDNNNNTKKRQHRRGRSRNRPSRRELLAGVSDDSSSSTDHPFHQQPHLQLFAHGPRWTMVGILATWIGFALSYSAFTSSAFVSLTHPLYVDPVWDEVIEVGMVHLQLCYNTTGLDDNSGGISTSIGRSYNEGCTIHRLTSSEIDDTMFQTARCMAFLSLLLGGFLSFFMTTAILWRSINLRPVGIGYLLTYFLQSFTFLFFDADLCASHECSVAQGAIMCALASFCWIMSCISAARMDSYKFTKTIEWMYEWGMSLSRSRSVNRSQSPTKSSTRTSPRKTDTLRKKELRREETTGTAPLSDDSFESSSSDDQDGYEELAIETTWKRPGESDSPSHSGRRFASNGCEIIQGIQDRHAAEAWAARSPKAVSTITASSKKSKSSTSSSKPPQQSNRRNRPKLTIDTNPSTADTSESQIGSQMSSTIWSVGSPIQPPQRNLIAIRRRPESPRPESPKKSSSPSFSSLPSTVRLDHSGHRTTSPTKSYNPSQSRSPRASSPMKARSPSKSCNSPNKAAGGGDGTTPTSQNAVFFVAEEQLGRKSSKSVSSPSSASVRRNEIERQLDELDALVQQSTPMNRSSPTSNNDKKEEKSSTSNRQKRGEGDLDVSGRNSSGRRERGRSTRSSSRSRQTQPSSSMTAPKHKHDRSESSPSSSRHHCRSSKVFDFLEEKESCGSERRRRYSQPPPPPPPSARSSSISRARASRSPSKATTLIL